MSSIIRRIVQSLSVFAVAVSTAAYAANPQTHTNPKISVGPTVRIVDKIDLSNVTKIAGTHSPIIDGLADMGRVPANTPLSHMMLVMKSTDEQEYALHTLLDQQQDKNHENYHQWMTPETFGAYFGVAKEDIAKVSAWLQDSGFSVDSVAKGGRIITFSGNVGQVEAAFHTEMHHYQVNGEMHMAASTDISIPAALSSVVLGPNRLNDFKPHSDAKALHVTVDPNTHKVLSATPWKGAPTGNTDAGGSTTFPNGEFVGGSDLAVLYDTAPLLAKGIQGQGQTLGIIGQTDVLLSDIQVYRYLFGLPANNYTRVQIGTDPGIIADDTESDLDLQVSGAMAPLANQIFYTSGNSYFGGGVDAAVEYVIEDNAADVWSMSYGECEGQLAPYGENAFYAYVYEQGAAQGQSFFISSGDSGPDTCEAYFNPANPAYLTTGYTVNGLGSTPYNVSVGGTQFNEGTSYNTPGATSFWSTYNTGVPYESALKFVPDQPWNETYFGTNTYGGLVSGGSGISFYYQTPSWQVGPGVPTHTDPVPPAGSYEPSIPAFGATGSPYAVAGPHRYMPDVSLNAAVYHDGTVLCSEGSCTLNSSGQLVQFGIVGGTSVASPTMAGAQALINQMNGGRQGNPNYYYYKAAAAQSATSCVAASYVATAGCSFHDSQAGNNHVPGANRSTTVEIGWNAAPGFDMAVGLDSPDVANLATNWSTINFNATTTALTISPTTTTNGANVTISVVVAPVSGTGTPTGDVGIIAQALYGGMGWITLSGGAGSLTFSDLPGGSYCIYAHYEGDTTFGGSNSPCVSVTVAQNTPTVAAISESLSTGGALTPTASFAYGTNVYINMGVLPANSANGYTTPSGTFTVGLSNGGGTLPSTTVGVDPNGTDIGTGFYPGGGYFDAGLGLAAYDIASTYPVLAPGTYTATVAYSGDVTYKAESAPAFQFTVGPITQPLTLKTSTPAVATGGSATMFATITTIDPTVGGVPAAGTVTLTDVTTGVACGTGTLSGAAVTSANVTINTTCTLAAGANSIIATFVGTLNAVGGSSYYNSAVSAAVTITVGTGTTTTTVVSPQAVNTYQVLNTVPIVATVAAATAGTVTFYNNGLEIGTATVGAAHTATLNYALFPAGNNIVTAQYGGVTTPAVLDASTSAPVTYTILKNTPSITMSSQNTGNTGTGYAENVALLFNPTSGTRAINQALAPNLTIQYLDAANGAPAAVIGTSLAAFLPGGDYDANFTTTALVPGYHVLSAKFVGDANYATATSNTQNVALGITSLAITTSTTAVGTGTPFTLTGTVTPAIATTTVIGGTVTFYDGPVSGGNVIAAIPVVNGVASGTVSLGANGTHTIYAVYSGDANFYTSSAVSSFTIVSVTPGYTISVNPSTIILPHNGSVTVTISATSFGNYSGIGSLYCVGMPANTFCPVNAYQQFTFNGVNGTQSWPLVLTAINAQGVATPMKAGFLWIPAMLLGGLLIFRRKQIKGMTRNMIALTILFCGMMATNGCSGGNDYSNFTTPTGKYTVTLTSVGTGSNGSPNVTPTTTLLVTVQ